MTTASPEAVVRLGDIDVRYRVFGAGPAVVFVHGLAEDGTSWRLQQRELSGYRTYAYDLRGHGGTSLGDADGSLPQLRDDLLGFLDEVSGPATCVGFSLGGTVVLAAAAEQPGLVTGAVVLGTSSVVGRAAAEFYRQRVEAASSGDGRALAETMRADTVAALADTSVDVDGLTARRMAAIGDGAGFASAASAMSSLRESPLTSTLVDVRCPVAVVGAEHDALCPRKAADILVEALPDATYRQVPGAGHLMNVDNPGAVTDALRAELARMN